MLFPKWVDHFQSPGVYAGGKGKTTLSATGFSQLPLQFMSILENELELVEFSRSQKGFTF